MVETNPMYDPRCNHDLPIPGPGCNRDMWTCRYPECTYPEAAPRRVRTQVERDADGAAWRRHDADGSHPPVHVYQSARQAGRDALDEEPELTVPGHLVQRRIADAAVDAAWQAALAAATPPRRRWWHRLTRRAL